MTAVAFRHAAVSTIAERRPQAMEFGAGVLGNVSRTIVETYYSEPTPEAAQRQYHALIEKLSAWPIG